MSKKIMKRSLALGALMAFVITGSAMAAELPSDGNNVSTQTYPNTSSTEPLKFSVSDNMNIVGNCEVVVGKYNTSVLDNNERISIEVNNGKTLAISTTYDEPASNVHGVIANTDIVGGNIYLKADNEGDQNPMAVLGQDSKDSITNAETIKLEGIGIDVYAMYSTDSWNEHKLSAKEIYLKSDARTVYAQGGLVEIEAEKFTVVSNKAEAESGRTNQALTANGDCNIVIKADNINVTGDLDVINSTNSKMNITDKDGTGTPDSMQITGNVNATIGQLNGLTFNGSDSFLKGAINTAGNENADVTFSDGATWKVTGASTVNTLAGDVNVEVSSFEEGLVSIENDETNSLTVSSTDEAVSNDASGDVTATTDEEKLRKIAKTISGKSGTYTAAITGGSVYETISATATNGTEGSETTIDTTTIKKVVDSKNTNANDMAAVGLMTWRAGTNDMNKRMGELRDANGEHGVWVRMVRGEQEFKGVKNQYNQYQLGYDEKLSVDKRWTVGAAISYIDAENSFKGGNGESKDKSLAIYGSKLNDDGSFVDLIAKYGRLENDFNISGAMGDADYDTNAYSFSAEFGKRIQQGKGMWIEPQVELTYGKVSAVDYVSENNVKVAQDSMESLIGRVGFRLGKDIKQGNVYARASYLYDFDGETVATLNDDAKLTQDLGGGWWEVGVGANINLSKSTYIYADIEKTFGGEVDTNWQWNLGVRYSF